MTPPRTPTPQSSLSEQEESVHEAPVASASPRAKRIDFGSVVGTNPTSMTSVSAARRRYLALTKLVDFDRAKYDLLSVSGAATSAHISRKPEVSKCLKTL